MNKTVVKHRSMRTVTNQKRVPFPFSGFIFPSFSRLKKGYKHEPTQQKYTTYYIQERNISLKKELHGNISIFQEYNSSKFDSQ